MPLDLPGRILQKISVPNAPFSCRLLPTPAATVVRKILTQLLANSEVLFLPPASFPLFHFPAIFVPRDLPGRILRKISIPNAPFSSLLLPTPAATVVRKILAQLFGQFQGAVFAASPPFFCLPTNQSKIGKKHI